MDNVQRECCAICNSPSCTGVISNVDTYDYNVRHLLDCMQRLQDPSIHTYILYEKLVPQI